jgi:hypothetical protein
MIRTWSTSFFAAAAAIVIAVVTPALAGSYLVAPGATTRIDVADRNGYTTIAIINSSAVAGSLQIPAGSADIAVPANGRTELYDRYSRSPAGSAYVTVTNTGSVPLKVISLYSVSVQLP